MKKLMALALASAAFIATPAQAVLVLEVWGTAELYREDSFYSPPYRTSYSTTEGTFSIKLTWPDWGFPVQDSNVGFIWSYPTSTSLDIKGWGSKNGPIILIDGPFPAASPDFVELPGTGEFFLPLIDVFGFGSVYRGTISSAWVRTYDDPDFTIAQISAAIPEPATWAMMIAGFGLAGAALRARRARVAHA